MAQQVPSPQLLALGNRRLVRQMAAQLFGVVAEWLVYLVALVYAFDRSGADAVGATSIALLLPYVFASPLTGALTARFRPQRVRVIGFTVQAAAYALAAAAVANHLPVALVIGPCIVGIAASTAMRPTAAVALPSVVRSSRELTVGNVWNGYCENGGPLLAALIASVTLASVGVTGAMAACAIAASLSVVLLVVPGPVVPPSGALYESHTADGNVGALVRTFRELRHRTGSIAVVTIMSVQFVVIGALELVVVVVADEFDLGDGGAGWLLTAFGVGGLGGTLVAARVARRRHLARPIVAAILATATISVALAGVLTPLGAMALLPLLGLSRSLIDILGDVLLHRSIDPDQLASVYAILELAGGVGLIAGSVTAQIAIATAGPRVALVAVGALLGVVLATTAHGIARADASAVVPGVAMRLFAHVPAFAALPRATLEDVARGAEELDVRPGATLTVEGEYGHRFYVVADGRFDITRGEERVASIGPGGSFGEIALLADVPRTATATAAHRSLVVAVERSAFLLAVTGHAPSRQAAWSAVRAMGIDDLLPPGTSEFTVAPEE
jgi:MFS family permease